MQDHHHTIKRPLVTIVSGCFNESENIPELHRRISEVMSSMPRYEYEVLIADNASTDTTQDVIRSVAITDRRFKAIFNVRNFGHIRSSYHALLQAQGDVVILMASDLEDPPELIRELLREWEDGFKVVAAVRRSTAETGIYPILRHIYYGLINRLSDVNMIENYTGFGAYDKQVISILRQINDPYPYLRGLVCELGFPIARVPFDKPYRQRGISKGTFYVYLDMALLGLVNHSKLPLRLSTLFGACVSLLSFAVGTFYLFMKLLFWESMQIGVAPVVVGMFFMMGVMLIMLGLVGEYIALVVTHTLNRPLVIEKERLNFD